MSPETKLKLANAVRYLLQEAPQPVQEAFNAACDQILDPESKGNLEAAFNFSAQ